MSELITCLQLQKRQAGKMGSSCPLGISRVGPARKSSPFGYVINPLLTKREVKMAEYWSRSFFAFLLTSTWPISSH